MTILLRTVLMRGPLRQIRGNRTTKVDRHRTRITDGTMGLRHRIKAAPMITRRPRHRRIGTEIMIEIEITTATGTANHITTCTQHQELL
jgi:hypothetical protein